VRFNAAISTGDRMLLSHSSCPLLVPPPYFVPPPPNSPVPSSVLSLAPSLVSALSLRLRRTSGYTRLPVGGLSAPRQRPSHFRLARIAPGCHRDPRSGYTLGHTPDNMADHPTTLLSRHLARGFRGAYQPRRGEGQSPRIRKPHGPRCCMP